MTRGQICNKIRELGFTVTSETGKLYTAIKGDIVITGPTPMSIWKQIKELK